MCVCTKAGAGAEAEFRNRIGVRARARARAKIKAKIRAHTFFTSNRRTNNDMLRESEIQCSVISFINAGTNHTERRRRKKNPNEKKKQPATESPLNKP